MAEDNLEVAKSVVDAVSVGTVAGSLMGVASTVGSFVNHNLDNHSYIGNGNGKEHC